MIFIHFPLFYWFSTIFKGYVLVFNGFRCVFHNCYWLSMICYWFFNYFHRISIDFHWISVAFHWAGCWAGCCSRLLSQAPAGCRLLLQATEQAAAGCCRLQAAARLLQAADFCCIFNDFLGFFMIFIDFRCIFNDFEGAGGSYSGDHTIGGGVRTQRAVIYTVFHEESEFQVKNKQTLEPGRKKKEKPT